MTKRKIKEPRSYKHRVILTNTDSTEVDEFVVKHKDPLKRIAFEALFTAYAEKNGWGMFFIDYTSFNIEKVASLELSVYHGATDHVHYYAKVQQL